MNFRVTLFVLTVCYASGCDAAPAEHATRGRVDQHVIRISVDERLDGDVESITDFAASPDALFVLDWRGGRVARVEGMNGRWRVTRTFARKGNGPGELISPVALHFDNDAGLLRVLERTGELEVFDSAGRYARTEHLRLPCSAARIQLERIAGQWLTGQQCAGSRESGLSGDTVYMMLSIVSADTPPAIVASQATATITGNWGSIFTATWPLTVTDDSVLFGGGVSTCVSAIHMRDFSHPRLRCESDYERFSAPVTKRFRSKAQVSRAAAWPDPLPLFMALSYTGKIPALVRPISADSVAFESTTSPRHYFAVAPLSSLVACKPQGCLWYAETLTGSLLHFAAAAELAAAWKASW